MKSTTKFIILLMVLKSISCSANENKEVNQGLLITAKAVSAEFIRNNITNGIHEPTTWKVKLDNIKVIEGNPSNYFTTLEVELYARSAKALLNYDRIYLKLASYSIFPEVLYWQRVMRISCIPNSLIDSNYNDFYKDDDLAGENGKCRPVKNISIVNNNTDQVEFENNYTSLLIIANAISAELIRAKSKDGVNKLPSWKVKLGNVKVFEGSPRNYPQTMNVELPSSNVKSLLNHDEIYLKLDSYSNLPKVLYWKKIFKKVCIPSRMIDMKYNEFYFDSKSLGAGYLCRYF